MLAGIAGMGLGEVTARKKGRGKKKGRRKSKKPAKANARADKVAVCHYDADQNTWVAISVSQAGWKNGHAKHEKDFQQAAKDGCCLDSECAALTDQCHVGTCVVDDDRVGACKAAPTPDAICDDGDACTRTAACNEDGVCVGRGVRPCQARQCNTVRCNPSSGECDYTPTPDAPCDGGTCNASGECIAACTPKTCAELGRVCGTAPDDGCGNPLDCGPASVCGTDIATNCCGGRCCTANGISCRSHAECCNGDCLGVEFFGIGTCNAFTNYICAP
jgi:hypothetical protein